MASQRETSRLLALACGCALSLALLSCAAVERRLTDPSAVPQVVSSPEAASATETAPPASPIAEIPRTPIVAIDAPPQLETEEATTPVAPPHKQPTVQELQGQIQELTSEAPPKNQAGYTPPAHSAVGVPVTAGGVGTPTAVALFQEAMISFRAAQYPKARERFAEFVEHHADHALAGNAQFYIGETYFLESNYSAAFKEFEKSLTSYPNSGRVSDVLQKLALCEDRLALPSQAIQHRQLLLTLFPQSPAAQSVSLAPSPLNPEPTPSTSPEAGL